MSYQIMTQGEFYTQMKAFFIANQDKITDLNTGSALDTQFKAMSVQLNQAMVKSSGNFKSQFESLPYSIFDFQRKESSKSSGTVYFSREIVALTQIDIPAGTIVGTSSGLLFTTQESVSILSGELDSSVVSIIAEEVGTTYNVFVGEITVINSSITGVNSVINNTSTSGGLDTEYNSEYFTRFTNFILGLSGSNRYGIMTAATLVSTIQSAYVEDHFPPVLDLYNFTVYVDDGSGNVIQSKLDEIKNVIYGDNTSVYPGYASAGVNFRVLSAGLIGLTVDYAADVDLVNYTETALKASISAAITSYVDALWVGSDVIWSNIIKIIQSVDGVNSISSVTLNGVSEDITATSSQVIRISTITETLS